MFVGSFGIDSRFVWILHMHSTPLAAVNICNWTTTELIQFCYGYKCALCNEIYITIYEVTDHCCISW